MTKKSWIALGIFCAVATAMMMMPSSADAGRRAPVALNAADADFIALREAALRGDMGEAGRISARLSDYPVQSYIEYYRLYPRLASAPEGEVRSFLSKHEGTAIGDRLRNDWLLLIGRARDWRLFDEQYPLFVLNDDTQLKCYALLSKLAKGEKVAKAAQDLLVQPKAYGEACVDLIGRLQREKQFSETDVWKQIRLSVEFGVPGTARRIAAFTEVSEKQLVQAIDKPNVIIDQGATGSRVARELFIIAIGRLARTDVERAAKVLERMQTRLSGEELAAAWAQIALPASLSLSKDAAPYWRKSWGALLSQEGYQWRARAALREADWPMVAKAIESMPPDLQKDPTWIYWRGRALLAAGAAEDAHKYFQLIAGQHNFYGILAMEELGLKVAPLPRPQPPKADEIAEASNNTGLRHALKFLDMELRFEGNREWNWQLRKMNERQLLATAEFARRSEVLDRMVTTADRTKLELDLTQRYPTPYDDIMQNATRPIGLDKAWVYGLIRQESRFIRAARSQVGASGLMQIMPATATYVARKIGMSGFSLSTLNDIKTNITLGTQYLNMVLANLGGSQTLATAAYNAGPGRPRQWRSTLSKPVEGAIFAETIPFTETRVYVKNVMSNTTWYAAMFENKPQSMKTRLGMVTPRDANLAELGDLP
ncbi:MAG: lytic transglycosylase domain-containing protein [Oxalobacteraceae bacterium]|nr:lytic transglycosylase domain-containing protein [Oxalobacteraceae bacterium]